MGNEFDKIMGSIQSSMSGNIVNVSLPQEEGTKSCASSLQVSELLNMPCTPRGEIKSKSRARYRVPAEGGTLACRLSKGVDYSLTSGVTN
eukprot:5016665-Amphidinium_carterae.1